MEKAFVTMPAKPRENNTGSIIATSVSDYLGDVFDAKKILTVNLLHTYKNSEQYLDSYFEDIKNTGNRYDILLRDIDYVNKVLDLIRDMIDIGIVKTGSEKIIRCDCGRVELSRNGIRKKNNASIYKVDGNKVICNCCQGECKEYDEKILYIPIEDEKITEINVIPNILSKCVNGKNKEMSGTRFIISKNRNTGYTVNHNDVDYNIDVDFIWMNIFRFIDAENKYLVCSNKQSLKVFYINYLYSIYKKDKMDFILHPIINNISDQFYESEDSLRKKLSILFSMSWNRESCQFNNSVYSYLSKMSSTELQQLYEKMCNVLKDNNPNCEKSKRIEYVLKNGTNFNYLTKK